jgi:hypothetical protein
MGTIFTLIQLSVPSEMNPFVPEFFFPAPTDADSFSQSETESSSLDFGFDLKDSSPFAMGSSSRLFSDLPPAEFSPNTVPAPHPPTPPRPPSHRPKAASRGPPIPSARPMPAFPAPFLVGKLNPSAMEQFQPHPRLNPPKPWTSPTNSAMRSDQLFAEMCRNPNTILNPAALCFIPVIFWPNRDFAFGDLVYDFFQRKNSVNCRFLHKLYNALRISTISPTWAELVGVQWQAPFVIRVNKGQFARLLGIQTIDGGLFHQQGNFRTHGFAELNREQVLTYVPNLDLSQVDFDDVRLLVHEQGIFVKNCTERQLQEMQARMNGRHH